MMDEQKPLQHENTNFREDFVLTEEDFAPAPPKPLGPLSRLPISSSANPALFGFFSFWLFSFCYWTQPWGSNLVVNGQAIFQDHQYYRLITALFVHSDIGHLLSNTPLFLVFGWFLCGFFGIAVFPIAALVIGALANLATVATYSPNTQLVGASGMVYGMVALWLILYIRFDTTNSLFMRIFRAIAFSLVVMFPTTFHSEVSYAAHGFGFLFGLIVGCVIRKKNLLASPI